MLAMDERRERKRRRRPPHSDPEVQATSMHSDTAYGPLRCRLFWTNEMDKVYLALLVEHALKGGKEGSTFKREAWHDMLFRFNNKTDMNVGIGQLKNRIRFYRYEYRVVKALKDHPEFDWDEKKQLVVADEACWFKYAAKNAAARFYKQKPVTCFRELEVIFGRSNESDNQSYPLQDVDIMEEGTIEGIDGAEATEVCKPYLESKDPKDDTIEPSDGTNVANSPMPRPSIGIDPRKRYRAYPALPSRQFGRRCSPGRYENEGEGNLIRPLETSDKKPASAMFGLEKFKTLDDCFAELNAMEGLDDELYVKALIILRDEYNRYIFLNTSGRRRLAWLQVITRDVDV